jgi:uncharacterized protein (DUF433 family)
MKYQKIITLESDKRGGKPCIRGLRITVYDVLDWLASGMTPAEIIVDFPEMNLEDILACLAFAADREKNHNLDQSSVKLLPSSREELQAEFRAGKA